MVKAGLIVPTLHGRVPPDAAALYPGTEFLVEGIGVSSLTAEGYAEAQTRLEVCARSLAERGAGAVLLFGTSLSFDRGPAYNRELEARMRAASGLPALTLTSALVAALSQLGARRLAVATAYTEAVNQKFSAYFSAEGFQILSIKGMELTALDAVEAAGPGQIAALSAKVHAMAPKAEALVISCAGLTTAGICQKLEDDLGLPVLSSSMVGAWAAQGLAGGATAAHGFGRFYHRKDFLWPSE